MTLTKNGIDSDTGIAPNNILHQNGSGIIDAGTATTADHNLVDLVPTFLNAAGADLR